MPLGASSLEGRRNKAKAMLYLASGLSTDRASGLCGMNSSTLARIRSQSVPELQSLQDDPHALADKLYAQARLDMAIATSEVMHDALEGDTKPTDARTLTLIAQALKNVDAIKPPVAAKPAPDATPGTPKAGGLGARGKG